MASTPLEAPARKRSLWRSFAILFAVLGPGFVTASAGNDVGGIATYSAAGAQFGYSIIWVLIPLAVGLIVVQEMSTRMGCVTGKGLAALFRENFGVKISVLAMLVLFLTNTLITSTEFAGIAAASEMFGISRYLAVPLSLVCVFFFVLRFNNKVVERTFVVFSLIYLTYIVSAVLAHPDWHQVVHGTLVPSIQLSTPGWVTMVVGIIGTTISPYMQFFLQSAVVEKGSDEADLTLARVDVINGSVLAIVLAGFMMIASAATIFLANEHGANLHPSQAADFAVALRPLAGPLASAVFALGILNAGLFTATVLPLSTSYIICEALGFEAAVDRKFSEAPFFFTIFAAGLIIGAGFVLLVPHQQLLQLILFAQNLQGILLPFELVLMLIIINRKSVMGEYTNSRTANIIAWTTAIVIGALSLLYVLSQFIPRLLGG